MRSRSRVFTCAFLVAFSCWGTGSTFGAGETAWHGPFFFCHMTDPQLGMYTDNRDFARETGLFEKAVAQANRLKPAFVVIGGDLVHRPGDAHQTAEAIRICRMLDSDIPLYLVCGNHDIGDIPAPESLANYRSTVASDWYSFRHGGCYGIVLNSTIIVSPENVPGEAQRQLEWLREELENARRYQAVHIFVFQHHPLFFERADEPDSNCNIPLTQRRIYLQLFRRYGVAAVFAGHCHRNGHGKDESFEMITTGPVGKPAGADPSGFRIVNVFRERIQHSYYGLDAVPGRVVITGTPAAVQRKETAGSLP